MSSERMMEEGEQVGKKGSGFFRSRLRLFLVALFPLLVLAAMVYWFATKGAGFIETPAFPVEKLDFERIVLRSGEIIAYVRNTGPYEVTIAQVTISPKA